jgi:hypothetical protein
MTKQNELTGPNKVRAYYIKRHWPNKRRIQTRQKDTCLQESS